jgi:aspartate aminotransferase
MAHTPDLSQRARRMPASPIRRLAPFAVEARRAGKKVYGLNIGQPDIPTPREVLDRLRTFDAACVEYGPSQGLPEFVQALHTYYGKAGIEVEERDIFVTTGGSEAIQFVLGMIADDGDEVIVFEPFYTNYNGFSAMLGVRPVPVTTRAEDGYHLPDREAIEARITDRTRAVLVCSPNNPTGTVYSDEELEVLASICRDRNLFLVADEVYREFTYDGRKHRSVLTLQGLEDRAVVVDSLSKRISVCGLRIGCIVSRNRGLMDAILRCGQARLCPPTIGQYISCVINEIPGTYMSGVIEEYQRRRDLVYASLTAIEGVTLRKPEGAFYVCARLPVNDAGSFAEFLLRDFDLEGETVMIAPADGFYATPGLGKDEARLAYVLNERDLDRALKAFASGLKAFRRHGTPASDSPE